MTLANSHTPVHAPPVHATVSGAVLLVDWPGLAGGRPGGEPPSGDAGAGTWSADLLARFWREDAPGLEWVADFLHDAALADLLFGLTREPEEEEEPEEIYRRADLVRIGGADYDSGDY